MRRRFRRDVGDRFIRVVGHAGGDQQKIERSAVRC
jgi:hypothetical protein